MIKMFWIKGLNNWGDKLNPVLVERLSGQKVEWVDKNHGSPFYSVIGSHLSQSISSQAIVWGTGVLNNGIKLNPYAKYLAVRGPLTHKAVVEGGGECPEVFGDPGLLTSHILPAYKGRAIWNEWGVILHHREREVFGDSISRKGVLAIDVTQPKLEEFILQVTSCRFIISSSLHGIIAAHSYGIPAIWYRPTNLPLGDGTKFHDYLLSQDLDVVWVGGKFNDRLLWMAEKGLQCPKLNLQPLLDVCPFYLREQHDLSNL